nr:right-handed parallel beta-helix repeat-containing protein [Tissierella sp.]
MFIDSNYLGVKLLLLAIVFLTLFSTSCKKSSIIDDVSERNSYYVALDGNDDALGSMDDPFITIQRGISVLKPGDTLFIRSGTYQEKVNIENSGSAINFITIKNFPGEKAIIKGDSQGDAILSIFNKSYIRIEGLNLSGNSGNNTPMGIRIEGAGRDIELVNNKVYDIISDSNAHGIAVYGTNPKTSISNLLIENNEVYNCKLGQSEALVLNGNVRDFKVINNTIHDNDNIAIDFIGYEGTSDLGETDRARDGICSGNKVYNISSINNPTYNDFGAVGIYVDGGKNIIIERNYIQNCDIGIEIASEHRGRNTEEIIVRNNLILDSTDYAALSIGGESKSNGQAINIKIYNNTIYNADTALVIANADSDTNEVKNNIFNKTNTLIEGITGKNIIENNISFEAEFVDPLSGNFELKSTSLCIDAGILVDSGIYDYSLKTRIINGVVDIGCLEYSPDD